MNQISEQFAQAMDQAQKGIARGTNSGDSNNDNRSDRNVEGERQAVKEGAATLCECMRRAGPSSEIGAILDRLRSHRSLASVATLEMAEHLQWRRVLAATALDAVLGAVDECAAELQHRWTGGESIPRATVAIQVARFVDNARRRAQTATRGAAAAVGGSEAATNATGGTGSVQLECALAALASSERPEREIIAIGELLFRAMRFGRGGPPPPDFSGAAPSPPSEEGRAVVRRMSIAEARRLVGRRSRSGRRWRHGTAPSNGPAGQHRASVSIGASTCADERALPARCQAARAEGALPAEPTVSTRDAQQAQGGG